MYGRINSVKDYSYYLDSFWKAYVHAMDDPETLTIEGDKLDIDAFTA